MGEFKEPTAAALWVVLARAYHSVAAYVEESIASLNIGLSDFMILEALLHKGPLPVQALGDVVLLASPSTTAAVDRMEKKRYVERVPHATDRRVRLVQLTAEGTTVIKRLYAKHVHDLDELTRELNMVEKRFLYEGLKLLGKRADFIPQDRLMLARLSKRHHLKSAADASGLVRRAAAKERGPRRPA